MDISLVVILVSIWVIPGMFAGMKYDTCNCEEDMNCPRRRTRFRVHLKFAYYGLLSFQQKYRAKICPECFGGEEEKTGK